MCAHIFTAGYLVQLYPMKNKDNPNPGNASQTFVENIGIPNILVVDNAP